ncbi:MAG: Dabb family protein [Saprospiraceae bacterium]|nr:Dabb family protein [Saprospiraceae bacterium]
MNRRLFSKWSVSLAAFAGLSTISCSGSTEKANKMQSVFIHQVYFWLKNPENVEDQQKLKEGFELLKICKSIQSYHIGKPAGTSREVIDGSYSYSWLTVFASAADQDAYLVDPIHDKFRDEYHHLWSKVVVYDSVDV